MFDKKKHSISATVAPLGARRPPFCAESGDRRASESLGGYARDVWSRGPRRRTSTTNNNVIPQGAGICRYDVGEIQRSRRLTMPVGSVTLGGGGNPTGGCSVSDGRGSPATLGHHSVIGTSRGVPPPPRGGQLLRLSQLTEEEREKLHEEWLLPLYLPRRLSKGNSPDYRKTANGGLEDPSLLPQTFRPKERVH